MGYMRHTMFFLMGMLLFMTCCALILMWMMWMLMTNQHPYVVKEIPNFLTHAECDRIIERARAAGIMPSRVYGNTSDDVSMNVRMSEQAWLSDDSNDSDPVVQSITKRVSELTNYPKSHQEKLQVVHYGVGGKFTPHYDACDSSKNDCSRFGSQRLATLLIYLNDDFEGGGTRFPKIDKTVVPEKGKAVLFYNIDSTTWAHTIIPESLHEGLPILHGEKWVANKWVRVEPFTFVAS